MGCSAKMLPVKYAGERCNSSAETGKRGVPKIKVFLASVISFVTVINEIYI